MTEKMPLTFVREYLRWKGRKHLEILGCEECDLLYLGPGWGEGPESDEAWAHPIRFLWEHISKGHHPRFVVEFVWTWDAGSPEARPEDRTPYCGWKDTEVLWDSEKEHFVQGYVDQEIDIT